MKKIIKITSIIISFALCLFAFTGCKKEKDPNVINLGEVTHSIFYAPLYVALEKDFFKDEGLTVTLTNYNGADKVMSAILTKAADIGLMGPEATVYCHAEGQKDYPIIFGQLTKRDGSFLVGRSAQTNFDWSSLKGKHIIAGRAGGLPAMTLQYVMNKAGLQHNVDNTKIDTSVDFANIVPTYESESKYDYCTMFEPTASQFVGAGKGAIVASVGTASGEVPYTAFSASKSYLEANRENAVKFLRAVYKGYKFILTSTATEIANALKGQFTTFTDEQIIASVNSYIAIDAWNSSPIMTKASFDKLLEIINNYKPLDATVEFDKIVDNSLALDVID